MIFRFDEENHAYFLDDKPLTGVTTILGVIAKPALVQWSANEVAKWIKTNCDKQEHGWLVREEELEEARYAHRRKKEDAGQKGTDIHALVEDWIKTGNLPEEIPPQLQKFIDWATENNVKFLASEQQVYSRKYWYAGTYDFICEIDGKKYVGDLKTSSGIYGREYFAQCAAYRLAHEEMSLDEEVKRYNKGDVWSTDTPFDGSVVVRCGKKEDFEVKYSYDYKTDKKIFLAALDLYRGLETFKIKK